MLDQKEILGLNRGVVGTNDCRNKTLQGVSYFQVKQHRIGSVIFLGENFSQEELTAPRKFNSTPGEREREKKSHPLSIIQ